MSYNTLNQASGPPSLRTAGGQTMVTSAQVMQFLGGMGQQSGASGVMAQNILQLMQQTPTLNNAITRELTPLVQMNSPDEGLIARTLDDVSVRYQAQITALPGRAGGERQAAGQYMAQVVSNLPAAHTPQGRQLATQLSQGNLSAGVLKQLDGLLRHAATGADQPALKEALGRLQRAVPEAKAELSKLGELLENHDSAGEAESKKREKSVAQGRPETPDKPLSSDSLESQAQVGERQPRERGGESGSDGQAWAFEDEPEDDDALRIRSASSSGVLNTEMQTRQAAALSGVAASTKVDAAGASDSESISAQALGMVLPPAAASVSPQRAEYSARHILKDSRVSLSSLTAAPLDNMLLQAATLGLKTFSNSADALSKSIKINGDAQEVLMDKKIADYREQLAKAQEQAEKAKKGGLLGKILNPIMTIISVVIKPVMNLLEKIPGVKSAMDFITKNLSEIAFPLAVITAIFCPMSLPMTLGLLAVTATTAGFSLAEKTLGDKAPSWLKIADRIGDGLSGLAMMACAGVMVGGVLRTSGMTARFTGWLGESGKAALKKLSAVTRVLNAMTGIGNGAGQMVLGIEQASLQREIGNIAARLGWNEAQANWLKSAQEYTVDRLQREISRSATVVESASQMLSETATLRARIAGSLV